MNSSKDADDRRNAAIAYQQVVSAREYAMRDPARYTSYYIDCLAAYSTNYGHLATAAAAPVAQQPSPITMPVIAGMRPAFSPFIPTPALAPAPAPAPARAPARAPAPAVVRPHHAPTPSAYPSSCATWADAAMKAADLSFQPGSAAHTMRKAEISTDIFAIVRAAKEDGTLWTRDWSKESVPGSKESLSLLPIARGAFVPKGKKRALPPPDAGGNLAHINSMKVWSKGGGAKTAAAPISDFAASMFAATGGAGVAEALSAAAASGGVVDWTAFAVTGTSTELEKRFFRLIGSPDPAAVRPEPALVRSLHHLRMRADEGAPYLYLSDQLKAVRQDLVVQHIKGCLAVEVYEWHAALALSSGDAAELGQCAVQLTELWAVARIEGGARAAAADSAQIDFAAVRLITSAHGGDTVGAAGILCGLPRATLNDTRIQTALSVRAALAADNVVRFFKLKAMAQPLTLAAMEWCCPRVRTRALAALVRAAPPKGATLPLHFLMNVLGFDGEAATAAFVVSVGGILEANGGALDAGASSIGAARETAAHEDEIKRAGLGLLTGLAVR